MNVIFGLTIILLYAKADENKFPDDFIFGVATSAYQIEGAWNISGKGENMWDRLTHTRPELIVDYETADVACDSYNKLEDDLNILQWVGVSHYRFSLSWSRLLPTGFANEINEDGVRYYNELINGLLVRNITPVVTLYHWDLPQSLSEFGGWTNEVIADYFLDYARVVFNLFGDRVKLWITINEPYQICHRGYGEAIAAPGIHSDGIGIYLCGRTILLAHAKAYRLYDQEFRSYQNGKVGFTADSFWCEPTTNSAADIAAAERAMEFHFGWFMNPIFSKTGDYPEVMKERIAAISAEENYPKSRLIPFTEYEIDFIRGTFDFMGLNYYTTNMASANTSKITWSSPSLMKDSDVFLYKHPDWIVSEAEWIFDVPWGLRNMLNWIKYKYDNPLVYITENGVADKDEQNDKLRNNYLKGHLQAVLQAINDGCNVKGYIHWSMMDNFEWNFGYTLRFGLFYVDFTSSNRTRIPKDSAFYFKCVIENKNPECL